jgi:hypothetical protein
MAVSSTIAAIYERRLTEVVAKSVHLLTNIAVLDSGCAVLHRVQRRGIRPGDSVHAFIHPVHRQGARSYQAQNRFARHAPMMRERVRREPFSQDWIVHLFKVRVGGIVKGGICQNPACFGCQYRRGGKVYRLDILTQPPGGPTAAPAAALFRVSITGVCIQCFYCSCPSSCPLSWPLVTFQFTNVGLRCYSCPLCYSCPRAVARLL